MRLNGMRALVTAALLAAAQAGAQQRPSTLPRITPTTGLADSSLFICNDSTKTFTRACTFKSLQQRLAFKPFDSLKTGGTGPVVASGPLISGNGTNGVLQARKVNQSITTLLSYDEASDQITIAKTVAGASVTNVLASPIVHGTSFATGGLAVPVVAGTYRIHWYVIFSSAVGNTSGILPQVTFPTATTSVINLFAPTTSTSAFTFIADATTTSPKTLGIFGQRDASGTSTRDWVQIEAVFTVTSSGSIDLQFKKNNAGDTITELVGSYVVFQKVG